MFISKVNTNVQARGSIKWLEQSNQWSAFMHVSGFNNNVQFQILYELMYLWKQFVIPLLKLLQFIYLFLHVKSIVHCMISFT